jgi:hypothetical protein
MSLVSWNERFGAVRWGAWRGESGDGEVAITGGCGWLLEREDGVAVRLIANKLAVAMGGKKLF